MAKQTKAPKGGAPQQKRAPPLKPYMHQPQARAKVTAEQMLADKAKFKQLMYKPGQVKDPEGMQVEDAFLKQLEFVASLADINVDSPVLNANNTIYGSHETYEECMRVSADSNAMILLEALNRTIDFSDQENRIDRGWINLLKIIVSLYCGNPYTRDRIGFLMWSIAKHISPSCYFPLNLDLYYDPRLWHRPGQVLRPHLEIPQSYTFDGTGQEFGPEDDIWSCELPDPRS